MATHASTELRRAISRRPAAPRATYDVRSACFGTAVSIAGLIALLVVLILI
ncbi:hypothetical protein GTV32_15300 [Gordonia sp. SID5947]|uniref:hypothetical protein n=1 Tax=Gordonia sp. SID5947 TaxID=2690315 RepID=UPI00136A9181|nr:hypothetical protein [Gordonia sp. SID5947]MYR07587.1 hypothetical protein [Gordonia sp. SID5947]